MFSYKNTEITNNNNKNPQFDKLAAELTKCSSLEKVQPFHPFNGEHRKLTYIIISLIRIVISFFI